MVSAQIESRQESRPLLFRHTQGFPGRPDDDGVQAHHAARDLVGDVALARWQALQLFEVALPLLAQGPVAGPVPVGALDVVARVGEALFG